MKVKELKALYPHYDIVIVGYLDSMPFAELPKELRGLYGKKFDKICNELEVKAYKHIDKPIESTNITHLIIGGKKHPNSKYNGMLIIALKGEKR